jgi:hypothetical protein
MENQLRLVWGADEKCYEPDDLSQEMLRAFALVAAAKLMGKSGETAPVGFARDSMRASLQQAGATEEKAGSCNGWLKLSEILAEYDPEMSVDYDTLMILQAMAHRPEHLRVIAASLAWETVNNAGSPIRTRRLVLDLLPNGPPTRAHLDDLLSYYEKNPEILWPGLMVEVS